MIHPEDAEVINEATSTAYLKHHARGWPAWAWLRFAPLRTCRATVLAWTPRHPEESEGQGVIELRSTANAVGWSVLATVASPNAYLAFDIKRMFKQQPTNLHRLWRGEEVMHEQSHKLLWDMITKKTQDELIKCRTAYPDTRVFRSREDVCRTRRWGDGYADGKGRSEPGKKCLARLLRLLLRSSGQFFAESTTSLRSAS